MVRGAKLHNIWELTKKRAEKVGWLLFPHKKFGGVGEKLLPLPNNFIIFI